MIGWYWWAAAIGLVVVLALCRRPLGALCRLLVRSGLGLVFLWVFQGFGALLGVELGSTCSTAWCWARWGCLASPCCSWPSGPGDEDRPGDRAVFFSCSCKILISCHILLLESLGQLWYNSHAGYRFRFWQHRSGTAPMQDGPQTRCYRHHVPAAEHDDITI